MKQIILLISLTAVLVGIAIAQDDGTIIQNLNSIIAKAHKQSPDDDGGALVQDVGKEERLKDLKSLLAKTQDGDGDSLADVEDQMTLPKAQDSWQTTAQEDDLDSLLAESQREDELLQKVLAGAQNGIDDGNGMMKNFAIEQEDKDFLLADEQEVGAVQDEDDEEALAQNVYDKEQISAEEQDLESPSALAQDKEAKTQWYRYYARYYSRYYSRYYNRYYARYYNRYYARHYARYYNKYYKRHYGKNYNRNLSYYIRYYNRYYARYYYRHYTRYYSRYYNRYYGGMYRRSCKTKGWWRRTWGK